MSMRIRRRVTGEDVALLVPAAAGTAAFAYIGGTFPLFARAAGGGALLILLPWLPLFVLLVAPSAMQSHHLPFTPRGLPIPGPRFPSAQALIMPLPLPAVLRT